jgi:hypothetical protein
LILFLLLLILPVLILARRLSNQRARQGFNWNIIGILLAVMKASHILAEHRAHGARKDVSVARLALVDLASCLDGLSVLKVVQLALLAFKLEG